MFAKIKKTLCKKKSRPVVAVVKLNGVIGKVGFNQGISLDSIKYLKKITKIKNLKCLALVINSPGGSPVQSELISKKITSIANDYKTKLPIISFCEDVAASGGYWLACTGSEIYASNSSIVGSIGVISQSFGFTDTIKKLGIERRVLTQGDNKSVLDPFSKLKDEDIKLVGEIQKDIHQSFIDHVKQNRKNKLKSSDKELFNGKFWSGKQAKSIGLIDDIGYYEEILKKKFGKKTIFKHISPQKSFLQKKFSCFINSLFNEISIKIDETLINNKYKL